VAFGNSFGRGKIERVIVRKTEKISGMQTDYKKNITDNDSGKCNPHEPARFSRSRWEPEGCFAH
jgi:hypothetical protein